MAFSINGIIGKLSGGLFATSSASCLRLRSITPDNGSVNGGTDIALKLKEFGDDVVSILVDGNAASIIDKSDTIINFTTPAGSAPGVVDVYASTGLLNDTLVDAFTYNPAPDPPTPGAIWSDPVYLGRHADGRLMVIKQAENLLYRRFYGEPSYLVKKKSTGVRCTSCWSASRQQRTKTHCSVCDGSGFVDGYYCAVEIQIAFDSEDLKSDSQRSFEDVYDSKRARMSNYPMVRPKDLIINKDDYKRYVVKHVETTKLPLHSTTAVKLSKQNYVVSQLLTLQELNPDDNEYNVDIP